MTAVPYSYVSYCPDNPALGRWDQEFIGRVIAGDEWRVPGGFRFIETQWTPDDRRGRVVIFPSGHYADHSEVSVAVKRLRNELAMLPWAVVICTSDERSTFPWDQMRDVFEQPSYALWVQTPRPEKKYPEGTYFFPLGSPTSPWRYAMVGQANGWAKPIDVFFSGQDTHQRRHDCIRMLQQLEHELSEHTFRVQATEGFTQGYPVEEYINLMTKARIVPCPSGVDCQESFRLYEALEAVAHPIVDGVRPDGGGQGFWEMLGFTNYQVRDWATDGRAAVRMHALSRNEPPSANIRWQQAKRSITRKLHADVAECSGAHIERRIPDDYITVVIPTSPIPSHPSTEILREAIRSVRDRLPLAEIHILMDGVRNEQADRAVDYYRYVYNVATMCNHDATVVPVLHRPHRHQSGMFRRALLDIDTPYVLFVEHDTPLEGDIDFREVLAWMQRDEIAMMRFHHETHILDSSAHLFLETTPEPGRPYLRTVQWSQRPHLAHTDWYRDIMATYFGWDSRTMIEDVMHGIVQQHHVGNTKRLLRGWQKWRMAVWAPEDNIKRSGHLDGRETEEKYDMFIAYDDERPEGAPEPGWWR